MAFQTGVIFPVAGDLVSLRPLREQDAPAMLPYFSSDEVCRFIPWVPRGIEGVLEFIAKNESFSVPVSDGDTFVLGIEHEALGLVGQVNLVLKSAHSACADVGYVINPEFHGRGIAPAALALLLGLAFGPLGLRRVRAVVDDRNFASVRVVEKLNFRLEAREVEAELFKGELVTLLSFAMLSKDFGGRTTL